MLATRKWQQINLDVVHVAEHEVLACDDGGPVQHVSLVLRDECLPVGALGRREVHADHPVARRIQVRAQRHHCALVVHVVELRLELVYQTRERELLPSCAKTNVLAYMSKYVITLQSTVQYVQIYACISNSE